MKKSILFLLLFIQVGLLAQAPVVTDTKRFAFEPDLPLKPEVISPEMFLGYPLGERLTVYAKVEAYFEALAGNSDRVIINQYGETYEGKPLINLVISSEKNINRIETLRKEHLELLTADPAKAEEIMTDAPVFTSFSYNIHGNETSSTEAAMQVAYRMAAATDAATLDVLDKSVIIMYICINPDGRDRYVYWYNGMQRAQPGLEPRDLEHYAPWPNGRTNHYWFDLNRDWIWGVHPESRGHTAEYQLWMPQVHVDYHEQGYNSNYFTMPGTTPRNKLLPDSYEAWSDTFGTANVKAFDEHQLNYFTRDRFDFFYPGYGSSYPSVLGAIGMLTEQGGIGGGRIIETDDGYHLTLRQRIFDHYTTSVQTINKSAERRKALLEYSYKAWQPASNKTKTATYVFRPESTYAEEVVQVLLRNKVEVEQATEDFTIAQARNYRTGKTEKVSLPKGSYLVSTNQPRHLFITSIMERNMAIEDSVMYDMATWSAPIAYNLDAWSAGATVNVKSKKVSALTPTEGRLLHPSAQYAFVIDWNQLNAPKALSMLWQHKYRVRVAHEPFGDGERTFPAGTLIVLRGRNLERADKIEADMKKIATATAVEIVGCETGRMTDGMDLASSRNRPVKQPKVALLVEPPFNTYTCGQLYFLFDQVSGLPVERVRTSILKQTAIPKFGQRYGGADLNEYDVLLLAGGGSGLKELFQEEQLKELKAWVQNGGTLVATESAASFFTQKKSAFTKAKLKETAKDSSKAANYLPFSEREDYYGKKRIPGSALNAMLDITHPLAFGLPKEVYSLKFGTDAIEPSTDVQTVGYYQAEDKLLVAGYASEENLKHLSGQTFAGVVPMGQGSVVLLLDNTQYRMFWRGPSRIMQNAVMLWPAFE